MAPHLFLIFLSFSSFHHSTASSFKPSCTLPPPDTNFVSGPGTRGTISILWNCISIFILCTWTIQRLNIPAARRDAGWVHKIWWAILDSRTKISWMLFTIFIPEFILGKALGEREATKRPWPGMRDHAKKAGDDAQEWTSGHARMANMGYFALDFSDFPESDWKELHKSAREVAKLPLYSERSTRINMARLRHRCWALTEHQWDIVLDKHLADYPDVRLSHLADLNKSDVIARVLAVIQVVYLAIQLLARKVYGLASAQIEIAALAFAATSFVTYILFWDQPDGVRSRRVVKAKKLPTADQVGVISLWGPTYLWSGFRRRARIDGELDLVPIPNDGSNVSRNGMWEMPQSIRGYFGNQGSQVLYLILGALFAGTLFGGIHCLAWNFDFPTHIEQILWRVCSVLTAALPVLASPLLALWIPARGRDGTLTGYLATGTIRRIEIACLVCLAILLVGYILARGFLLVEMFRTLFFLPPDAFTETWSASFPHWG
ncbi:hypothetical protein QBC47DRAFT_463181 [Echria macrotheca]|uniref:Integral membrane protein n=1 Tax=Echria macrotheca TaxID=438768 RepID=A0AAJ0F2R1_9PEZI|nr:hypothetical protein QBC47DRAFT_463181 [Echria macrotheca]